jgi:hypothetical protein
MNNTAQAEAALNAAKAKKSKMIAAAFAYLKANSAKIVAITAIAVVVTTVMASYIRGQDALVSTFSAGLVQQERIDRKEAIARLERKLETLSKPLTVPAEYRHSRRGVISSIRDFLGLTRITVTVTPGAGVTATTDDGRSYVALEGSFVQVR